MPELDEYDLLLGVSLIDERYERAKKRRDKLTRGINIYIWSITAVTVTSALMKWWTLWTIGIAVEFLAIPAMIYGHNKIDREENKWLESKLPRWAKGLTNEQKGERND